MKKLFYIFACFTLLCSCSAEKRLAYLLSHHPELRKDTVLRIDTFLVHPADTASTTFTIEDLQQLLQQDTAALGSDSTPVYANPANSLSKASASIRVENNGSIATITPNADGSFTLNGITKPDTIIIHDSIPVPAYVTTYKDKIVYKMNNAQTFFFGLGILFLVLMALVIGIRIAKMFI